MQYRVVFVANTTWYLYNFYLPLLESFKQKGYQVFVLSPRDKSVDALKGRGFYYYHIPLDRKGILPISNILTLISLSFWYRSIKPHLAFHFTIKPVIFGSLAAKIFTKAKIINNITGLGYVFINNTTKGKTIRKVATFLYRLALKNSFAITFQNRSDREYFLTNVLSTKYEEKIHIIPGAGIDLKKFDCERKIKTPQEVVRFILVGRMLWDKGIGEFIEAIKSIKRDHKNACFYLLGPVDFGNPANIGIDYINDWVSRGLVDYLGQTDDVRPFLCNADVFVLPSYREGLSQAILEAMAMRMPIITTDAPGCRETVKPMFNGIIVKVKDVNSLRSAIEFFIKHPEKIYAMGENSRALVKEKFSVEKVITAFGELIKKAGYDF